MAEHGDPVKSDPLIPAKGIILSVVLGAAAWTLVFWAVFGRG